MKVVLFAFILVLYACDARHTGEELSEFSDNASSSPTASNDSQGSTTTSCNENLCINIVSRDDNTNEEVIERSIETSDSEFLAVVEIPEGVLHKSSLRFDASADTSACTFIVYSPYFYVLSTQDTAFVPPSDILTTVDCTEDADGNGLPDQAGCYLGAATSIPDFPTFTGEFNTVSQSDPSVSFTDIPSSNSLGYSHNRAVVNYTFTRQTIGGGFEDLIDGAPIEFSTAALGNINSPTDDRRINGPTNGQDIEFTSNVNGTVNTAGESLAANLPTHWLDYYVDCRDERWNLITRVAIVIDDNENFNDAQDDHFETWAIP